MWGPVLVVAYRKPCVSCQSPATAGLGSWTLRTCSGHISNTRRRQLLTCCRLLPTKQFGDHILPETHRAALANLRKQPKETLREYEDRVRRLMSKAYPGMIGIPMFQTLEIEHLVTELPDPNMAFDILVRKPSTVGEALNLIEWYECGKASQKRRSSVRQVGSQDPRPTETGRPMIYNVAGSSCGKWVMEECLQQFSSELRKDLVSDQGLSQPKIFTHRQWPLLKPK